MIRTVYVDHKSQRTYCAGIVNTSALALHDHLIVRLQNGANQNTQRV